MKKTNSIKELLNAARDYLGGNASGTLSLDVELLLAHVLSVDREYLFINDDKELDDGLVDLYRSYLERLKDGEPVAYITQGKEFYGFDFFVDNRVLVPRPETEYLVEKILNYLKLKKEEKNGFRILDVGTGSGNIAVSVVAAAEKEFPGLFVDMDAVDVSEEALEVARINAAHHGVEDRVNLFQSDLMESIDNDEGYDIIVANLPYIGEVKNRFVSVNTEKHEPNVALFGGEDGLSLYKKMFQQIEEKNVAYGMMLGEFGVAQGESMGALLSNFFDQRWGIEKDLAGIDRVFTII